MALTNDRVMRRSDQPAASDAAPDVYSPLRSHALAYSLIWLAFGLGLLALGINHVRSIDVTAWLGLASVGFAMFTLSRCAPTGVWSPASQFILTLAIFHISLAVYIVTGLDPELPRVSDYEWYTGEIGAKALYLTTLGVWAYSQAALLILVRRSQPRPKSESTISESALIDRFAVVGSLLLIASVTGWFALSISQVGVSGLTGSYLDFLDQTRDSPVGQMYPLIGVGLGFTVLKPWKGWLNSLALAAFFAFGLVGFFLGLRGEVLYPIVVAVTVMATRRKMPSLIVTLVGIFVLLGLVNAARQIRLSGVSQSNLTLSDVSPLAAVSELGQTLRVPATVLIWHDEGGEPFRNGDTYTVAIARLWERLATGAHQIPAEQDFRLFNSEIAARSGQIGGSIIGEAYHNFAAWGVILVLAIFGVIFAYFSRAPFTATKLAVCVVVAMPLLGHIRNSFVPVIPEILIGLVGVFVLRLTVSRKRELSPSISARRG